MEHSESRPPDAGKEHFTLWRSILERLDQNLSLLIHGREDEFLALGTKIQKFSNDARGLARQAGSLTGLTAGEEITKVIDALGYELGQINEICGFARREADLQRLVLILRLIASLKARMGNFRRIVRTLQMLGVTTRIESARLGDKGRGFMNLAVQVDSLGMSIVDYWGRIDADSKKLNAHVEKALARTRHLVREQEEVAQKALGKGQENLNTLNHVTEQSGAVSQRLSERAGEVSARVGSVVASLQFHDIVRQQVEHVNEAVKDVLDMIPQPGDVHQGWERRQVEELACWTADVSSLQASQLRSSRTRFIQAIETLIQDLSSILGNVAGLGQDLQSVLASEEDAGQNALDRIEDNIQELIKFMQSVAEKSGQLAEIMNSVGVTVAQMATFVGNIEEVGSEIELIALNASVQAAHTGEEGMALGVLAGAIQRLSMDARELTDVVANELREISGNALELQNMADASKDTGELDRQVGRLEGMINNLRALNRQSEEMFLQVRSGADQLRLELTDQVEDITFHHSVGEEFENRICEFEDLAKQALTLTSGDCDPANRPARLQELLSRYTMEAERLVHLGLEGSEEDDGSGDVELFGDEPGDEFGDNVELF